MALAAAVHLLTHTVRMRTALAETPGHPRVAEYARQIVVYGAQWAALSPADRASALAAASGIHDMTDAALSAAVAALEG